MYKFTFIFSVVLMVTSCTQLLAQDYSVVDRRAIKHFEEGENYLSRRQFEEAAEKFQAAYERSNDFYEAYVKHSQILLSRGRAEDALEIARKGEIRVKNNDTFKGQFAWLISQILLNKGAFPEAVRKFEEAVPYMGEFTQSGFFKEKKKQMDFIAAEIRQPKSLTKERLPDPINGFRLQYFPVLTADSQKILFTKRDGLNNHEHEDIYVAYQDNGNWTKPISISSAINTRYNEGTCTISADGNILIFTSCDTPDSFGSCDLYIAEKVSGDWQKPVNMGKNVNTRYWDSQPSLSADGSVLFFSSNRKDGHGGNDIWYTERNENGTWSEAKNVGPYVNTSKDEVSPFIFFNNEVLFFASDGHVGFGGKDLYMSRFEQGQFGDPVNLGYPINDQNDQLALFITAQKDYAYYTENSYRGGNVDSSFIYRFNFPKEIDLGEKIIVSEGRVYSQSTGEPVEAKLSLVDLNNDSTLYRFQSDGKEGQFTMLYPDKAFTGLYVEKKGYIPKIYNVEKDSLKDRRNIEIELVPVETGKNFVFENIFFDFDKADLKDESVSSLRRLKHFLDEHPDVSILIEGHTDNIGNPAYNENLSKRRADSVKDYLASLGVAPSRLKTEGKGDSEPIKPNNTEENRSLNRRIEIIIL
ncbi:OmpA family protein [Negadavirga shengliensis]|uniref:OmpA family protein n=1 Tax=Negadavirga shengliensis TaxID=1389218 RepID=A0ABV9T6Z6_9BACT